MALDSSELRISLQRLLAALTVVLVALAVFGLYIGLQADRHVHQMDGAYFRALTRSAAATTSEYIGQRVTDINVIANEPNLIQALTTANRTYEQMGESAIRAKTEQIENKWSSADADPLLKTILTSDLARLLRRHRELNPRLLKITVADEQGASVAATDKPLHYFQTDHEYWRGLYSQGQGAVYITDIHYDEQSRSHYLSIGVPVRQESSGRFIGAVTALVDVSPVFAYLDQQQIARSGRVFLVKDDGTVIHAHGVTPSMRMKSEEYRAIQDALGTVQGREAGYLQATLPNRETYLIGFADTGLKQAYPNLGWIVIASLDEREASGPIRTMAQFALLVLILGLLMLIVFGAHMFLHRKQELADLEMPPQEKRKSAAA
jgi:Cache domain